MRGVRGERTSGRAKEPRGAALERQLAEVKKAEAQKARGSSTNFPYSHHPRSLATTLAHSRNNGVSKCQQTSHRQYRHLIHRRSGTSKSIRTCGARFVSGSNRWFGGHRAGQPQQWLPALCAVGRLRHRVAGLALELGRPLVAVPEPLLQQAVVHGTQRASRAARVRRSVQGGRRRGAHGSCQVREHDAGRRARCRLAGHCCHPDLRPRRTGSCRFESYGSDARDCRGRCRRDLCFRPWYVESIVSMSGAFPSRAFARRRGTLGPWSLICSRAGSYHDG